MPRKPATKPWLHKASGQWCITRGGKRIYLDRDYQTACRKLTDLNQEQLRIEAGGTEWLDHSFASLANEYLTDLEKRRKPGTYKLKRHQLLHALKILGTELTVGQMKKFHLGRIEQEMTGNYSPTTVHDVIAAVQAVYHWAVRFDLLSHNPLVGYAKPSRRTRNRIIEPAEFQALLRHADTRFKRFLIAARYTGCRPGELRTLLWEWVDLERGFWILPDHKTVTQQRNPMPRLVPLPDPIWKLCHFLGRDHDARREHVFLNAHHRPYSKNCLVKKMQRLRERAGIETKAGENLVLYSARHSFATATVGKVSDFELATLLGHTDTKMIRRYVHLNPDHLRDIRRRAD